MKSLKMLIGVTSLLALTTFTFSAPADAHPRYDRGGHHHHGPYRYWHKHRHRYWGPHISIGFVAPILPAGYVSLAFGGTRYFYHGGYFYHPAPSGYVVVSAPLGAAVKALPASAVRVEVGGAIYYQCAGTYYQWDPVKRAYVVVPPPQTASGSTSGYTPGQVVETLPVGYTAEVINGIQYYRYGDDYFMPTQRDGREVYVVVRI